MTWLLEIAKWWGIISGSLSAGTLLYLLTTGKAAAWRAALMPIWLSLYYILLWIPLFILGWILIPFEAYFDEYDYNYTTKLYEFFEPFMAIYNNNTDGITCQDKNPDGSYVFWPTVTDLYGRIWRWSAMRNPLASITLIPGVHCTIQPNYVNFIGSLSSWTGHDGQETENNPNHPFYQQTQQYNQNVPVWYISWQGLFSSWYWQFNWQGLSIFGKQVFAPGLYLIWIGAKIKPTDIWGVEAYRTPRTYNTI